MYKLLLFLLIPFICSAQILDQIDNQLLHLKGTLDVTVTGAGVSTWADQSGESKDFVQTTDADRPNYVSSAYLDFDKANTEFLERADDSDFSFVNGGSDTPFSIAVRVYMDDATSFRIMGKSSGGVNVEWFFGTNPSDQLVFALYDDGTGKSISTVSASIQGDEGSWITVVGTYNGGGANTDLLLYIDGSLVSVTPGSAGSYVAMTNTSARITIGQLEFASSYADGRISDLIITTDVLTPTEIAGIHSYFTTGLYEKKIYVDAVSGNDDNTGASPANALASFDSINTAGLTLVADDTITIRTGTTVRGTLTIPRDSVYYTGYDSATGLTGADALALGDTAVISGADLITPGTSWDVGGGGGWADAFSEVKTGWSDQSSGVSGQYRNVFNNADLDVSGTAIRVSFLAHSTEGSGIDGASIGPRTGSTDDMSSGPTRISFSTEDTVVVAAGDTVVSDSVAYVLNAGVDQLIHVYYKDQADLVFKSITGGTYYDTEAAADNTMDASWVSDGASGNLRASYRVEVYNAPTPNVWQTALAAEPNAVFFDGAWGTEEAAIGNLDAALEWSWNANVLSVYSASDPDAAYTSPGIEVSQRDHCIYADDKSYITINGIKVVRADSSNIEINGDSDNWIIQNITSEYAYLHGIYVNDWPDTGDDLDGGLITASTFRYNAATGIYLRHNVIEWTISSNIASYNCLLEVDAEHHANTAGIRVTGTADSNIVIASNTVERNGFTSGNVEAVSGDRGFGIWTDTVNGPDLSGVVIRYNYSNWNRNTGIFSENENGTEIYYNISTNNKTSSAYTRGIYLDCSNGNYPTTNNEVYNNVCYGNNIGINVSGIPDSSLKAVDNLIRNNIISGNINRELRANDGGENNAGEGSGNEYTYNSFGIEASNCIEWNDGKYISTYAVFDDSVGSATNSVAGDPLFTDAANNDFTLTAQSPAIDAGTDVGLVLDFDGNVVPADVNRRLVDIGAFEFLIQLSYQKRYKRFTDFPKFKRY